MFVTDLNFSLVFFCLYYYFHDICLGKDNILFFHVVLYSSVLLLDSMSKTSPTFTLFHNDTDKKSMNRSLYIRNHIVYFINNEKTNVISLFLFFTETYTDCVILDKRHHGGEFN